MLRLRMCSLCACHCRRLFFHAVLWHCRLFRLPVLYSCSPLSALWLPCSGSLTDGIQVLFHCCPGLPGALSAPERRICCLCCIYLFQGVSACQVLLQASSPLFC